MAARTQTIDFLISRMEKLCDVESDTHLSSAEKFEIMNSAIAETWDLICDSGRGEKYVKSATFASVADQTEYPLFTIAADFYRVAQLYVVEANNNLRPLRSIPPAEVYPFKPPSTAVNMKLYYIPYSPILTTGQSFDGINGWEEHTLMTACCAVKLKREEDYSAYARRKQELVVRIRSLAQTDLAEPARVVQKRRRRMDPYSLYTPFMLFNQTINAYSVRGDKIELYRYDGYIP
jgi:hypothetical protein